MQLLISWVGEWVAAEVNKSSWKRREKLETPPAECPWDVTTTEVKISAEHPGLQEKYW